MEALKDFFHLDVILRQCLGGVVFFTAMFWDQNVIPSWLYDLNGTRLIGLVLVVFLVGSFFHVLQRAIFGPFVDHLRTFLIEESSIEMGEQTKEEKNRSNLRKHVREFLFSTPALEMTMFRMKLLDTKRQLWSELRTWGSSTHSLYTIALSLVFVTAIERDFFMILWAFCLALLGFISDCRKYLLEQRLKASSTPPDFPWITNPRSVEENLNPCSSTHR